MIALAAERRSPCQRQLEDDRLGVAIRGIHRDSRETYGAPRVHAMLRRRGICVSCKRVARLMREARISGLIKRRRGKTTIRVPGVATAPDLVRCEWNPTASNRLWVADITFIPGRRGGLYDFARRVLATEWGKQLYLRRQGSVESVFGQIKANRGVRRFQRRGRLAVRSEWRLLTATHNLLKLHQHHLAAAV